jgi:hypothetical protein
LYSAILLGYQSASRKAAQIFIILLSFSPFIFDIEMFEQQIEEGKSDKKESAALNKETATFDKELYYTRTSKIQASYMTVPFVGRIIIFSSAFLSLSLLWGLQFMFRNALRRNYRSESFSLTANELSTA